MNGNTTDRLSQKDNCRKEKIGSLLENAAEIARRVLSSIQALAGTTACKGVQIARLRELWKSYHIEYFFHKGTPVIYNWETL